MPRRSRDGSGEHATLLRQWAMVMAIPRWPASKTVQEIRARLQEEGHEVDVRSVQRDLNRLSSIFSFTCGPDAGGGRKQRWFFPQDMRTISVPEMPVAAALALLIAREQSRGLIPPATLTLLKSYFNAADAVLAGGSARELGRWKDRVCIVREGPGIRLPEVADVVLQPIYDGLLTDRQLDVRYRARGSDVSSDQLLHPLGIVTKSRMLYLVALAWDYEDPRHYALHRFEQVRLLDAPARRPVDFDLQAYAVKTFGYPLRDRKIRLKLRMEAYAAAHIMECPLSADQQSRTLDEAIEISATVDDTSDLRWWLAGYGAQVEVLAPAGLRREMADTAKRLMEMYAQ